MFYTYLIKNLKNKNYYCGITRNIFSRLSIHNRGGLKSTAKNRPWELVYIKNHRNYRDARKHEKWLKKKNRIYKDKLAQLAPPISGGVK